MKISQYVVSVVQKKELCYGSSATFLHRGHKLFLSGHWHLHRHGEKNQVLFKHSNTIQHDTLFWLGIFLTNLFPQGRFNIAAKHHIAIAEIYESELLDIDKVSGKRSVYVKVHIHQ